MEEALPLGGMNFVSLCDIIDPQQLTSYLIGVFFRLGSVLVKISVLCYEFLQFLLYKIKPQLLVNCILQLSMNNWYS